MGQLERRAEAISGEFISVSVQTLKEIFGPSCQAAFIRGPVHPSASQQQVSDTLQGMRLSVEDEFRCPKSGYSIDMRVHVRLNQKSSTGATAGWAVEFDGPSHFFTRVFLRALDVARK
jgi:hypothetical protein